MRVAILGGGLSGLAAAYRLSGKHQVTLLEEKDYLGGMASSYSIDWEGKTYSISKTYHHVLDGDRTTIDFIREFGLEGRLRKKKVRQGFVFQGGVKGFSSPLEILSFPIPLRDKFKLAKFILFDLKRQDWNSLKDVNAKEWVTQRAGKRNFEVFFDQLIRNKFHSPPEDISAPWLGTRFSKESSSFLKKFGWLEGGVSQIVEGFERGIKNKGGKIIRNAKVSKIRNKKTKEIVYLQNGKRKTIKSDVLVSAIPPRTFLGLVDRLDKDLKKKLESIEYLSCICLCMGLENSLIDRYWVNVLDRDLPFSVFFNHSSLYEDSAPPGKSVMFVTTYLKSKERQWSMSDREIMKLYAEAMDRILPGFSKWIEWWKIFRIEFAEAVYSMDFVNPPVSSGGIYFAGIYRIFPKIRNMASAIESGLEAAERLENEIEGVDFKG
jgi:protoporphyrinogen oxidase